MEHQSCHSDDCRVEQIEDISNIDLEEEDSEEEDCELLYGEPGSDEEEEEDDFSEEDDFEWEGSECPSVKKVLDPNTPYEFPAFNHLDDLEDEEYGTISHYPKETAVEILKTYLDNYYMGGEPMTWYVNTPANFQGNSEKIREIAHKWNSLMTEVIDANIAEECDIETLQDFKDLLHLCECSHTAQMAIYQTDGLYKVTIERFNELAVIEVVIYYLIPSEVREVLEVFYSTGRIYDENMYEIYDS